MEAAGSIPAATSSPCRMTPVHFADRSASQVPSRLRHGATLAAFTAVIAACLGAIVYNAWVCDDAYITVRALDNCARGFGLTWNPGERVQVFTHPLWAILLLAAHRVTQDFFYTAIGLGILLAALAVLVLAFRVAPTRRAACLAVAALAVSRAFTDYSTSGLENSLTHVLASALRGRLHGPQRPDTDAPSWSAHRALARQPAGCGIARPAGHGVVVRQRTATSHLESGRRRSPAARALGSLRVPLLRHVGAEHRTRQTCDRSRSGATRAARLAVPLELAPSRSNDARGHGLRDSTPNLATRPQGHPARGRRGTGAAVRGLDRRRLHEAGAS